MNVFKVVLRFSPNTAGCFLLSDSKRSEYFYNIFKWWRYFVQKFRIQSFIMFIYSSFEVLIIGGGIANFTNVAATFKGIVRVLEEYQTLIKTNNIKIFVRRAGPNYQEGLR